MKNRIMLLNVVLSLAMLSFSSCSIEGEEICGLWNSNGDYGKMQVEITPWKGRFLGYLLEYNDGNEIIKGSKTEDFIFITDLEYRENKYQSGKVYLDPNSEAYCGLTLELSNKNQLKATYDCGGRRSEETWYRNGTGIPEQIAQASNVAQNETKETSEEIALATDDSEKNRNLSNKKQAISLVDNSKAQSKVNIPSKVSNLEPPQIEGETKKQSTFYIIGIQEVVKYDDFKAMEKSIEALWTEAYNDDFSGKLKHIIDQDKMYVSYSSYDNPKGNLTITLGYKVKDLSNISSDLKGVKIPNNEYLVYPLSGDKSDFEGDGWEQLGQLMMYRKADSADFEVYTFDNSYNVKMAEMWIATK